MPVAQPAMAFGVPQYPSQLYTMPQPSQTEEEPLYVNAKQYNRILKRRAIRAKLEADLKAQRLRKVSAAVVIIGFFDTKCCDL